MRTILWGMAAMTLLTGCVSKEEQKLMYTFEKHKNYHKRLIKTEKVQLYEGDFTKVTLTATYLNRNSRAKEGEEDSFVNYINPFEIFEDREKRMPKEDERFIVGIYIDDENIGEDEVYDFDLTLNGNEPKSIKPLEKSDPRLKDISFVSEWSQFFYVVFPHVKAERFNLTFESEQYGKGILDFAKKAKFVYTKKAF
jgi:hypothetical protein